MRNLISSKLLTTGFTLAFIGTLGHFSAGTATAQTDITGYIQAEWQHFDLGEDSNGRGFYSDERKNLFLIRRGRVKFSHTSTEGSMGVIQVDATERGLSVKDAYLQVPLLDSNLLDVTVGLFNKPDYEVELSSKKRESTERSQVVRAFYPGERDLGFMFSSTPWPSATISPTLQLALFNGTGTKSEDDPFKDITARVHVPILSGDDSDVELGLGALYYIGGLNQPEDTVITFADGAQVLEDRERNSSWPGYGNRSHVGFEFQLGLDLLSLGETRLYGEYLFGKTPSSATRERLEITQVEEDSITFFDTVQVSIPTLAIRNQAGYYLTLVQGLGDHLSVAAKYDVFDRNTELSGDEVLKSSDRSSTVLGFGLFADFGPIRMTGWYEIPSFGENEARYTDPSGTVHTDDLKDNKTTIRFQYTMK